VGEANEALHEELAARPVVAGPAARGELDGMLAGLGAATAPRDGRGAATLADATVARRLYRLLRADGCEPRLFVGRRGGPRAGTVMRVTWAAPPGRARTDRGVTYARGYVRGMTLVCGYVSDPARGYSLEWNLDAAATAQGATRRLAARLRQLGAAPGQAAGRRGGVRVYVKDGEAVGDLLLQIEAPESMLYWENARALRAMRGRIHREVNGETANLRRTARAGARQAEAARALLVAGTDLPLALRQAAQARLDHPEASLVELATLVGLSKSGLNQRMRRLVTLARGLGLGGEEAHSGEVRRSGCS